MLFRRDERLAAYLRTQAPMARYVFPEWYECLVGLSADEIASTEGRVIAVAVDSVLDKIEMKNKGVPIVYIEEVTGNARVILSDGSDVWLVPWLAELLFNSSMMETTI